jgi:integrase
VHRGRWWAADLRPWGGGRTTVRDPDAPGWPRTGDRTEDRDIADRWKWAYVDALRVETRRVQLKLGPPARPLDEAIVAYLAHRETVVEPHTVKTDRTALTAHLLGGVAASTSTTDIDPKEIQRIFHGLRRQGYEPSTILHYRDKLSAFFGWLGGPNPMDAIEVPDAPEADAAPWADDELTVLRRTADKLDRKKVRDRKWPDSFRVLLELGVGVGPRYAEAMALEWPHFRPQDCTVRIARQMNERGTGLKPLKGKRARTALVLPSFWQWHRSGATGRVLTPPVGPAMPMLYTQRWARYLYSVAGLMTPGRGHHTLRHSYARLFLESGGSLDQLQWSLGHRSIQTTEHVYGHLTHDKAATLARQAIYGTGRRAALHVS